MGKFFIKFCLTAVVLLVSAGVVLALAVRTEKGRETVEGLLHKAADGRVEGWEDKWEDGLGKLDEGFDKLKDSLDKLGEKGEALAESGKTFADQVIGGSVSFDGYDIDEADMFDKEYEIESGNIERTFEAAAVNCLDVELGGCRLEIGESADGYLRIATENIGRFQAYQKDGKVSVKATRKAKEDAESCKIYLYLPGGHHLQEMDFTVGAGQILAQSLSAEKIHLEAGAGQIISDSITAEELEVSVGAGNVNLQNTAVSMLNAEVDAGKLQIKGDILQKVEAECAVGNLELRLSGTKQDYNYVFSCAAGNIYLDGEKQASGMGQEIKIDNNASRNMDLECSVGNITVTFEAR